MNVNFKILIARVSLLAVFALLCAFNAYGREAALKINVSGLVREPPEWVNAVNVPIRAIDLEFSEVADRSDPKKNVDSLMAITKLINAMTPTVSVGLTRPSNCSIGRRPVRDEHVYVRINGNELRRDSNFMVIDRIPNFVRLRFSGDGRYGDAAGIVSCQNPGLFRYVY